MTENICSQGHVIDFGREVCSRCNGRAIGTTEIAPVVVEASAGVAPVAKEKKAKVVKEKVVKAKKVVAKKVGKKKK